MNQSAELLPPQLQEIVADFAECEGHEKLEYLLEFAERLPPLPEWLVGKQAIMEHVHECITPIYIFAEERDGRLHYHFDIPPEGPAVRGFGALLSEGANGLTPEQLLAIPPDFYLDMGLNQVLSGQRLNGISAMLSHMKKLAHPHTQ